MKKPVNDSFKTPQIGLIEVENTDPTKKILEENLILAAKHALREAGSELMPVLIKSGPKLYFLYVEEGEFVVDDKFIGVKHVQNVNFSDKINIVTLDKLPQEIVNKLEPYYPEEPYKHGVESFTKNLEIVREEQNSNYSIAVVEVKDKDEVKPIIKAQKEKELSETPILFKIGKEIFIFGKTGDREWKYQALDATKFEELKFGAEIKTLSPKQVSHAVYAEINSKEAHFVYSKEYSNHVNFDSKTIEKLLVNEPWARKIIQLNLGDRRFSIDHRDIALMPLLLDKESFLVTPNDAGSRRCLLNIYAYLLLVHAKVIENNMLQHTAGREVKTLEYKKITADFENSHMQFAKNKYEALDKATEIRKKRKVTISTFVMTDQGRRQEVFDSKEIEKKQTVNRIWGMPYFQRANEIARNTASDRGCIVESVIFLTDDKYIFWDAPKTKKKEQIKFTQGEGQLMYSVFSQGKKYFIHHLAGTVAGTLKSDKEKEDFLRSKGWEPIVDKGGRYSVMLCINPLLMMEC